LYKNNFEIWKLQKYFGCNEKKRKALKAGEIAELTGIDKRSGQSNKTTCCRIKISSPKRCYYEAK
jgi:hypothetical protein